MNGDSADQSPRWQKRASGFALGVAAVLLAALVYAVVACREPAPLTEERLIGVWQSDADRTIAARREDRPVNEEQEAALRRIFGKLRVTYSATTYTTELDGVVETNRYQVLGRDNLSVVIREFEAQPPGFEATEFGIIHFDGPDSYWLHTKIGDMKEYFKRVE